MAKILSLDASTEVCSVALSDGEQQWQQRCDQPRSHSKVLLPMVDTLLAQSRMKLNDLDAIGVSHGPGSFTGIRIGLGIAQGLAYGAQVPLYGLDTLMTLAEGYRLSAGAVSTEQLLVTALDARMGEVYWAVYQSGDTGRLGVVSAPAVTSPQLMIERLSVAGAPPMVGIGHGWRVADTQRVTESFPGRAPEAGALLSLLAAHLTDHPVDASVPLLETVMVEPLYLRNEISWNKRERIREP